jgi:lipopolysaccharide transport system ATP-binding protein
MISIERLSKRYTLGEQVNGGGRRAGRADEFWALRDVNLEIERGEVVGLIGRNGAGKSTLLKILSRITLPTAGRIRLRGRTASLLEVATGFHPDLTGRENVFLNGAILGMSRAEIRRKFDEIVAFAEVERFLDTPVKRYSSGMYVRLAFAVAAHLEPEILVVDEVLAVGDAEFQQKCLDKLDDAGHTGRTVLFVSHNMQAVTRLSTRCVLLDKGRVALDGPAHRVAAAYLSAGIDATACREWPDRASAPGDGAVRLAAVRVRSDAGEAADTLDIRRPVGIELEYEVLEPGRLVQPSIALRNEEGMLLFVSDEADTALAAQRRAPGRYVSTGWIPGNLLAEGAVSVAVTLRTAPDDTVRAQVPDVVVFRVVDSLTARDTARGDYPRPLLGVVRPLLEWTTACAPLPGSLAASAAESVTA